MAQKPQFLTLLTSKCASRHNTVHFFDSESPSNRQKVVRTWGVLYIFTSKCASCHNGVHFFHISTSNSRPNLRCFVHFYFQMCFAPQRRALFSTSQLPKVIRTWGVLYIFTSTCASRHNGVHFFHIPNFQKSSETDMFCHFWLPNVLRATTVCTFSTSQLPKVVREWRVLTLFTSKCASRHNGVQFFISHLVSYLRTRRFREPTFDAPEPQNTGKTQCFATSLPFRAPASSLFWLSPSLTFSRITFSTSEFLPGCAISISQYCRKFSFQTSFEYMIYDLI